MTTTVPVQTGDVIDLGGVGMEFYAISEAEEREQAMRWGVAERPSAPAGPWAASWFSADAGRAVPARPGKGARWP
ncbi:MAG: hypothetical protein ACLUNZ_08120 [Evtepia sp.]